MKTRVPFFLLFLVGFLGLASFAVATDPKEKQLLTAAEKGDLPEVQRLLKEGAKAAAH